MSRTVRWYALGDPLPANRRARVGLWVEAFVDRLGLREHPGFRLDVGTEGYRDYAFGARVGPSCGIDGVVHELAHAVEFGPDEFEQRCTEGGFVFHTPTVFIGGRLCEVFNTGKASERELRTFGIEWRLLEMAGLRVREDAFFGHCVQVLSYMPDWISFHGQPELVREHVRAAYDAFTQERVSQRLQGWLDKTAARLHAGLAPTEGAQSVRL